MKCLLVNKFFWKKGGSEAVFFSESRLLVEHQHEVLHFAMEHPSNESSPYSKYFVSQVDYESGGLLSRMSTAARVIYSLEAKRNMARLLAEHEVDVAHFHIFQHQISPSVFAPLRARGVPVVLSLHDFKPICPNYLMYVNGKVCEECKGGRFYRAAVNRCTKDSLAKSLLSMVEMYVHRMMGVYKSVDRYIAVSQFYRQKMIEFGAPERQVVCVPNFVDVEEFRFEGKDSGYALYFGRLSGEKGLFTLLEAAGVASEVELVIAGTGPIEQDLKKRAREIGLTNVSFVGYKSGKELLTLISEASFTVLPSEWYENCPMTILESLSVGTPVLGARIGGIPELISEGVDGFTFTPFSVSELADRMVRLWRNRAMRLEMGRQGADKIRKEYTPELHYQRLMRVYSGVLSNVH